jgi:hypothetical protein
VAVDFRQSAFPFVLDIDNQIMDKYNISRAVVTDAQESARPTGRFTEDRQGEKQWTGNDR